MKTLSDRERYIIMEIRTDYVIERISVEEELIKNDNEDIEKMRDYLEIINYKIDTLTEVLKV